MAVPTTIKGGKVIVKLGDGGSPEVFAAPCGFNEKAFNRGKSLNTAVIPDCDDPDAASWEITDVASNNWGISGQGILAEEAVETWDAAFESTDPVNCKVEIQYSTGTVTYSGSVHIESLNIGASVGQRCSIDVSLKGNGALTRSPAL